MIIMFLLAFVCGGVAALLVCLGGADKEADKGDKDGKEGAK